MDALAAIAAEYNLFLLEDAAQAHGAEYKSRRCGSLGCIAGFSFYPGKNLGAYGEGGAVVTNDDKLAEKIRMLRDWGAKERYKHILPGYNYRMDGIQGAVLGVKMRYIEQWNEKRRLAAAVYLDLLSGITGLHLPQEMKYARHVYHVFALRHDRRDELAKYLTASGIASGIHYPLPLHLQECYKDWGYQAGDFPVAENLSATELSLPIYPEITGKQLESVAAALRTFNPA
jgi:dTDP-4-amino-4,6-dideoxygalactose transaminase